MVSQVGVQRVGFTVTENLCLHKTKLHACGYVGNPRAIYHMLHTGHANVIFTT